MQHSSYFLLIGFSLSATLTAQSYAGFSTDNYAGVHGLLLNPASVAASRTTFELHLGSVSGWADNSHVRFDAFKIREAFDTEYRTAIIDRTGLDDQFAYGNVDALGPSLMLSLSPKTGIALVTRARSFYTTTNMSGPFVEGVQGNFDELPDFAYDQQDHHSMLHSWGEVSFVFGTVLLERAQHHVRLGAAVKSLQGLGAVYTYGDRLSGQYASEAAELSITGDITYGRANDYYADDLSLENRRTGLGFDVGLTYEWGGSDTKGTLPYRPYRLKLAASVMDIGQLTYDGTTQTRFVLEHRVPVSRIEAADNPEAALAAEVDGTSEVADVSISLPTSLQLVADLRLTGPLYVSAHYATSLTEGAMTTTVPTVLTLTPRLEGRGLGIYLPFALREGLPATLGAGLRLGLFTVGSASLLTHVMNGGAHSLDVFAAVKFPFFRKRTAPPTGQADGAAHD